MRNEHDTRPVRPVPGTQSVTMRGPADMAELLPYLMGFFPDDSVVAVGLQGPDLHQGGVIRLDIPDGAAQWPAVAAETADLLIGLSAQRGPGPEQVLLYLCRDPGEEDDGPVVDRLGPLADALRESFEGRGVLVKESLCVSGGRWWSFLCRGDDCCDPAGHPIRRTTREPGPVAAAAAFAGLAPRGSRKAIVAGLAPVGPPTAEGQRLAFARVLAAVPGGAPREADAATGPGASGEQVAGLLDQAVAEFTAGARELDEERTARLLVALQDRRLRDRAAEYAEPSELAPAQRLWRFLARRCVPPYTAYAPPPLTLLAWTSWIAGDTATARVVLAHALRIDPTYLLAQLLYEALNGGLSPELLLEGVRAERARRASAAHRRTPAAPARPSPGPGPEPADGEEPTPDGPSGGAPAHGAVRRPVVVADSGDEPHRAPAVADTPTAPGASDPAASEDGAEGPERAGPLGGPVAVRPGCAHVQAHRVPGCRPALRPGRACGGQDGGKVRSGRVPRQATVTGEVRGRCAGVRGRTRGARRGS
ncbi:DUF4192 family protein [Kitasatospora sp. NPDC004240]